MFLTVRPLQPLNAVVNESSYQATLSDDGIASYSLRATLTDDANANEQPIRIGLRGTAKLYGDRTVLLYYLLRWPDDPAHIAAAITKQTPLTVSPEAVQDFAVFLKQHNLLRPDTEAKQRLLQQLNAPSWQQWRWWLRNYLFFRLPILRPQRFLQVLLPYVQPLFSWWAFAVLLCLTALGIVLVARRWDVFTHDVVQMFTPTGLLGFALALVVSKTLHELGHAMVATRYGVRVAHMGVAFLVLWPMLYTDTGESWRLKSSRQRLMISIAGVSVELALAGIATLLWTVLDEGALRQSMLYLATTDWVLSVALNASPFMRFDGYFILSDLLDFPNLHERAGAQARVWLTQYLARFDRALS